MVSTFPLISKSSSPGTMIDPTTSISSGIIVTFMFHRFFFILKQGLCIYLTFRFILILLCCLLGREKETLFGRFSFSVYFTSNSFAKIKWSVIISKSQRSFCVSFSRKDSGLYIYHWFVRWNIHILSNSQWMTFFIQFYTYFVIICSIRLSWNLIISFLFPHHQYLLFCCLLSIFAFTELVIVASFWASVWRDSVFL